MNVRTSASQRLYENALKAIESQGLAEENRQSQNEAAALQYEREINNNYNEAMNNPVLLKKQAPGLYREFAENLRTTMVESVLFGLYEQSCGKELRFISPASINLAKNMIHEYVVQRGAYDILSYMEESTAYLSTIALEINNEMGRILEEVDENDPDTMHVGCDKEINMYDCIKGNEDTMEIADVINMRVAQATEEFVNKNIEDREQINDIMYDAKEKIEALHSGDDESDQAIAKEMTDMMRVRVNETANRPHNVLEQLVINLTESIVADEELKANFVTEAGKLDMEKIVERATAIYRVHEMFNTIKLEKIDENKLEDIVNIAL